MTGSFSDINTERLRLAECEQPPDNCPVCLLDLQKDQESYGSKIPAGVAYHGNTFHLYDFVLIRADIGPCHIGHIVDILFPAKAHRNESPTIRARVLGRIGSLLGILPRNVVKDEVSGILVYTSLKYLKT